MVGHSYLPRIMYLTFKNLLVPFSNDTKQVNAVQLWEVRWESRHGEYSGNTKPEIEAFPSLEEAEEFAKALRNAFKLIKHTSKDSVTVSKAK